MNQSEISETIARIDERQRSASDKLVVLNVSIQDLCERVLELEQMRWKAIGAISAVIVVVEVFVKVFLK